MDPRGLRTALLSMVAEDLSVREELVREGSLFERYHPRMREVHERNAARLRAVLEECGWPRRSVVGDEAADAAWLILQHSIGNPDLQRLGLRLLRAAAAVSEAPMVQVAMLEDRIRCNEGKRQRYGTQFDWDEDGLLSPLPIDEEADVDKLRSEAGLVPLAEDIRRKRRRAAEEGERPPPAWHVRQREKEQWLRSTGWRD